MIGKTLAHYEITASIGKGGMGEVWKARDTRLGREVAIKTLPPEFSENEDHLARFRREARAASALNHPNICVVHDLDQHEGQPFIVMELLKGETLKEKLAGGSLGIDQALEIVDQLADALDAAHSEGIIHRDIKPANIFVTERRIAKLLDFGLARVQMVASAGAPTIDDITNSGTVLGTVSYMSPEQARGDELDARSDLFSLGVVFYEMVTGQAAFTGNTSAVIFDRLFNKVLDPPTHVNPNVPKEMDPLIAQLLEKDRNQRSSSARDLKNAITRLRRSTESRPPASTESAKKSIAVLPFENLSADADNDFFSDGLTEEIITDLSQIRSLRVISRNSSMQLKGSGKDLGSVASELDVRYVLEGSVRKAGNAVRVSAQLVDPLRDEHLWAERYSGKLEDIFEIQEQISRKIVGALKTQLSPEEDQKLAERQIDNVEAFECYHRAAYEIYKFTEDGLERALGLIDTALDLVGENALLYATKGVVYYQYVNALIKPPDEGYIKKAEECARQVFALESNSAAGHALIGMVHQNQGRPAEAIRSLKTALSIEPTNFYALQETSRVYMCVGREIEARSTQATLRSVDPLSPLTHSGPCFTQLFFGDNTVAVDEARRLLRYDPEFALARMFLALSLIHNQRFDEAHDVVKAVPDSIYTHTLFRFLKLALEGKRVEARSCLDPEFLERARNVEWWSWEVAECYAFIDEQDLAIEWLENAFQRGFWNYPYLTKQNTTFRRMDDNPRFQDLLKKVKTAWEQFEP